MKYILLGSVFPSCQINEILDNSIGDVQFAANYLQTKLMNGFRANSDEFLMFSAPAINHYPNGYKKIIYKPAVKDEGDIHYVKFNNVFGIRNISRKKHIIKRVKQMKLDLNERYVIISYSPSMAYINAAVRLSKMFKNSITISLLPDLPQFVSLSSRKSLIYSTLKKIDIASFSKQIKKFDGYIFLTDAMNEYIRCEKQRYIVMEGVASNVLTNNHCKPKQLIITYCGTLHEKYGIKTLVEAFEIVQRRYKDSVLNICGSGDCDSFVKDKQLNNSGIHFYGQVSHDFCINIELSSSVLVNPRGSSSDFTRYSFPSKNIEFLETQIPVVAFKLDGIPNEYYPFIHFPSKENACSLAETIIRVFENDYLYSSEYRTKLCNFLKSKSEKSTANRIGEFAKKLFAMK